MRPCYVCKRLCNCPFINLSQDELCINFEPKLDMEIKESYYPEEELE